MYPDPGQQAAQRMAQDAHRRHGEWAMDQQRRRRRAGKSTGSGFSLVLLIAAGAYIYFQQPELWDQITTRLNILIDHIQQSIQ